MAIKYSFSMSYLLAPHFSLEEFLQSPTADSRKICNLPNSPAELARVLNNLTRLAHGLEVLRGKLNRPLRITSGYRCPALNAAVGGVNNSRHMQGCAADVATTDTKRFCEVAASVPGITKLIPYPDRNFVHVESVES